MASSVPETPIRVFTTPDTPMPEVQLLSNGRYHVMITNAGGGYSRWKDLAVTRWHEDAPATTGARSVISATCQQASSGHPHISRRSRRPKHTRRFSPKGGPSFAVATTIMTPIQRSPFRPRMTLNCGASRITNRGRTRREIDVTSYAEVVLAPPAADASHPAFSNLFVQTEIIREQRAILCTRRPRSQDERVPWMMHLMAVHGAKSGEVSYETDRMRFIGRGNTVVDPQAMSGCCAGALSGSEGSVLDPIVAIRHRITLDPEKRQR
jgi:cyclic beta-1,2-glucan synthetase